MPTIIACKIIVLRNFYSFAKLLFLETSINKITKKKETSINIVSKKFEELFQKKILLILDDLILLKENCDRKLIQFFFY